MNAKEIFEKLAANAMHYLSWKGPNYIRRNPGKPGEWIERLPPEQRAELNNLTSKDTEIHDRRLLYISGTYPENTTTIHTHSVKTEEE